MCYSPWNHEESDTTAWLALSHLKVLSSPVILYYFQPRTPTKTFLLFLHLHRNKCLVVKLPWKMGYQVVVYGV